MTDPLGRVTTRYTTTQRDARDPDAPDGAALTFDVRRNGNVASIPPAGVRHTVLGTPPVDLATQYVPPDVAGVATDATTSPTTPIDATQVGPRRRSDGHAEPTTAQVASRVAFSRGTRYSYAPRRADFTHVGT